VELRSSNWGPHLTGLVEQQLEAYGQVRRSLARLGVAVRDRAVVKEDLECIELALEALESISLTIERDLAEPHCPGCGQPGFDVCTTCNLEVLIPVPEDARFTPCAEEVVLAPEYQRVFHLYEDVLAGKVTLLRLLNSLAPLESRLQEKANIARILIHQGQALEGMGRIPELVAESLDGLDQMREAGESREMLDLAQGWDRVFRAALDLNDVMDGIARASGRAPALSRRTQGTSDSVVLSHEN
ncbi:MAG: hypothetical protein KC910_00005, partial [Candidatus Eremiobacteraeota bacterium]|nr:hypothetical protein [Candidatus Eremiobacteraeota bacterium]